MDIDAGSIYITNSTNIVADTITGGDTVRIDAQKVDHNINKTLIEFNIPTADAAKAPEAGIIDLKQIKHVVSVQGLLANDSTNTAYKKKEILMFLMGYGGTAEDSMMSALSPSKGFITLVYGRTAQSAQHKVTGNIVKIMITETPEEMTIGNGGTAVKAPIGYSVQVQVAVGKNRMGGTN